VSLGIAQALLAAVLALAAVVLKALGFAQGVILGTAGLVLVVSGVLLVVWSDRDDRPGVANTPAETAYRSAA
jgi:glucose uptake protein GlcU